MPYGLYFYHIQISSQSLKANNAESPSVLNLFKGKGSFSDIVQIFVKGLDILNNYFQWLYST